MTSNDLCRLVGEYVLKSNVSTHDDTKVVDYKAGHKVKVIDTNEEKGEVLVDFGDHQSWWLDTAFSRLADDKAEKVA